MYDSDSSLHSLSPSPVRSSQSAPRRREHDETHRGARSTRAIRLRDPAGGEDPGKTRKLSQRNVAMKIFAKKYGGHDIMRRFAENWPSNRMNKDSRRYDPGYASEMMREHGTVAAKPRKARGKGAAKGDAPRAKRAPSEYNLFVQEFARKNRDVPREQLMQKAAAAWRQRKGSS